jgi:hydroxyacylglutathione hydrolase
VGEGAIVVDARPFEAFASGHVQGALSNVLRPVFASWLGWLTDPDQPVVVVLDDDQDELDLVRQALTIGHDNFAGRLTGEVDAWVAAGLVVETTELIEPNQIDREVLDVRQDAEFAAGHVPGADHIELGTLPNVAVHDGPLATMCGKSERAMTAASVLQRAGHEDVGVVRGGFTAWSAIVGHEPVVDS